MLRLDRPEASADFEAGARSARSAVEAAVAAQRRPDFEDRHWRRFKAVLLEAQHRKCGFCEVKMTESVGVVEHYRPKSEIRALADEPDHWGRERDNSTHFSGRKTRLVSSMGYYWLAYSWSNYSVACERCNSWKGSLFPVASERELPVSPQNASREQPLLLEPFGELEPSAHLSFDRYGHIEPVAGSEHGPELLSKSWGLPGRISNRRFRSLLVKSVGEPAGEDLGGALAPSHFG